MKVWGINYDGRFRRIVAAGNQQQAADLLGVTLYAIRTWGCTTDNPEELALALSEPGTVWSRQEYAIDAGWIRVAPQLTQGEHHESTRPQEIARKRT